MLAPSDIAVFDELIATLGSAHPWFPHVDTLTASDQSLVVATCGNWYDLQKAQPLARIARGHPSSELLLTGGREERLTSAAAADAGGESLLLHRHLLKLGVDARRMIVWTGSRVTNHNLRVILGYAKQLREFDGIARNVTLLLVEERFLVRREAASLFNLLAADADARAAIASVRFVPVGPRRFLRLVSLHGGRADVAAALVVGEYTRLSRYAHAGNATTATHGTRQHGAFVSVEALAALSPRLRGQLDRLIARHGVPGGLLAEGRRILEEMPRAEMLTIATPSALHEVR